MTRVPVRVLHVLARDDWGGTEVQVRELARRSPGNRCIHVVAVIDPSGPLHRILREDGVETRLLGGRGGPLGAAWRLSRVLRDERWGVVEAYGFRAGMVARLGRRLARSSAPLLMGVRGLHMGEAEDPRALKTRVVLAAERALVRGVAGYDANSEGARTFLVSRGFPADRFVVIRNGVEFAEPAARRIDTGVDATRVLCVGRFVPRKRQSVLVEAVASLVAEGCVVRCEFVGAGPTLAATKRLAEGSGASGAFAFSGRIPQTEVAARLREADVFVLCSLWEGMPGSVLEAMSAGLPVVATDVSGTREAVVDRVTGLFVPPENPPALARALAALASDPEARAAMGRAGQERVRDHFSYPRLVEQKENYFERIAAARIPT